MKKIFYIFVFLLTQCVFLPFSSAKTNTLDCNKFKASKIIEVQKGVYVRPSKNGVVFEDENIANIGFIVGEEAVAVIDTGGSIKEGKRLLCKIKQVTKLPIRYVINTHVHPDHTLGNAVFSDPSIKFIGHQNLTHAMGVLSKTYLRRYNEVTGDNVSDDSIILPQIQVTDELEIDLGNRILTITAVKKAHTNNDLLVYDNKTATLWLSDLLFHKHIPVIGKSGSVNGWLALLNKLKQNPVKYIIPGHGPVPSDNADAITTQAVYLTLLRDEIRKNISTDADLSAAMESIGIDESSKWQMKSQYHKRNISYIFSELEWE